MFYKVAVLTVALGSLTACTQRYETPPVEVETPDGPVTCQLYAPWLVLWDEPVTYPEAMDKAEAVSVCRQEGMFRKFGE
ncbi:hypothetical protein E4L95_03635 [Paracoccus liaowanqingii]|uniref:YnbE family lipoprotein n=1 Tax=Paracoccus liaowanqingii TaxID=2560053 RepID=A0A4P7HIG0_9RHOB|nr:hypothetical protein [Paracoccus liaowanqingii]QBX33865.1 YnbE family lipoprotein [Paracoccus liaowanqingii]TGN67847.1 hypothetical protein E4L95_03635 [Paracoccus liaowanqingii]